jgi:serine/threonine protein kinase
LQVAEGLDVCHQQGLIHGLLKPSNLMAGAGGQVFILDFGIGCLLAETEGESLVDTMSTANAVTSGLDCASPESIMDPQNLTPTGDQYSLGCTLYFMLTGQYPFAEGSAAEKMMAHQFNEPKPLAELNPDVPLELQAVVQRLMQKTPENRFPSTSEAVEALRLLERDAAPAPHTYTTAPAARPSGNASPSTAPRSVGPSTPTPKPQNLGVLPTRNSLRTQLALPTPEPETRPEPRAQEPGENRVIPGATEDQPATAWDERLGPVGIGVSALVACGLVYALAVWLQLF